MSGAANSGSDRPLTGSGVDEQRDRALELDRLRGEERRAGIARLAATLTHALGTPLNVISGRAAMLGMRELGQEQLADNARIIGEQVRSITDTLNHVLAFVREGWPEPAPMDLSALVRRAVSLLRPVAEARSVRLELGPVEELSAQVHGSRLELVLVDLLGAGIGAVAPGAGVTLSLAGKNLEPPAHARGRALGGLMARFDVTLQGVTLPEPDFGSAYEPWLQHEHGDADERSLAMLYAVSFGLAREERGWVEVGVEPGVGSTLSLCWPIGGGA